MPTVTLPTNEGQYTNVDEFVSGKPAQIVNLMVDEAGGLTSRPGVTTYAAPVDSGSGVGSDTNFIALHPFGDRLIAVRGNRRVHSIDSAGTHTDITKDILSGTNTPTFHVAPDGSLLIFGGGLPLRVGPELEARAFATGLTGWPTHGAVVDHSLVVNNLGSQTCQFSEILNYGNFDEATSTSLTHPGVFSAGTRGDDINAVATLQNRLFLFGEDSVEVFYGTGGVVVDGIATAFRLEDDPLQSGCLAGNSVKQAENTLWWLDNRRRFVRLEGRQATSVSSAVDAQIRALTTVSDCVTHFMEFDGHKLLLLHLEASAVTLVLDVVLGVWSEWRTWDNTNGVWKAGPFRAYAYHPGWNRHFCSGSTADGEVLELKSTEYRDPGSEPLVRLWRGPFIDGGSTSLKKATRLRFLLDGGTATSYTSTAEGYNPEIEVRWRNEDRYWQDWQSLQLGRVGERGVSRDVWVNSNFRSQQIEWRCSAPARISVGRIELEAEPRLR